MFLAAFAVGGIATSVTTLIRAATEHQAAFAVLDQVVKDSGAANEVYGKSIQSLLEQEARLKGFSDEQLASAFQRLVSATHDSAKAFVQLGDAENLARFRHIDLANAALILAKLDQGKYTALQRIGIVVQKVTTAEDALKLAHERLIAAGGKLDQTDKERYATALAAAKAADAQKTAQNALAEVQARTGGSAAAFAQTAAGQFARLQQDFHQFEVAIGTPLLAGLSGAAEGLGGFFTKVTAGGEATKVGKVAAHDLGVVLHDLGVIAETVGPPLLTVAKGVAGIVSAVGAPALLAAYGTFKAIGVATAIAATAQAFYIRTVAAGTPAVAIATAENVALAGAEVAVGAAGETAAAGGLAAFGAGLAAIATGPGAIIIGLAALAGGIAYLSTRESDWTAANNAATTSLQGLTSALEAQKTAQGPLAKSAAATNVAAEVKKTSDAFVALGAAATASTVPMALAFTGREPSIEVHRAALERLRLQTGENITAEKKYVDAIGQQVLALGKSNPLLSHNLDLIAQLAQAIHRVPTQIEIQLLINNQLPGAALSEITAGIQNLFIAPFLLPQAKKLPVTIGQQWAQDTANAAKAAAAASKSAARDAIADQSEAAGQAAIQSLRDSIATDQSGLSQLQTDMANAITQGAQAVNQAIQSAKQNLNTIGQSLASSIAAYIDKPLNDAAQHLSDAQDRIAAVYDRKSAALNTQIAAVQRQQAAISAAGNVLALSQISREVSLPGGKSLSSNPVVALRELEALQASIARRTGHADPALTAYILQYRTAALTVEADKLNLKKTALDASHTAATTGIQLATDALKLRQDAAAHAKQQALTQIAALTDELNKGAISIPAFDIALSKVLAKNHLSFIAAAKQDGIAFADTFAAQLGGLGLQEAALRAGPQRAGTGLIPNIVRPLDTLQQTQKTIAGIASQERGKQLSESKKQTELLHKISAAQATVAFSNSLDKNPGQAAKRQQHLVGVGG